MAKQAQQHGRLFSSACHCMPWNRNAARLFVIAFLALPFLLTGQGVPPANAADQLPQLLQRLTLCSQPDALAQLRMHAVEAWMDRHGSTLTRRDFETDRVFFYRGVELEETISNNGQPLSAPEQQEEQHDSKNLERKIDRVWAGPQDSCRLVNINGEIWKLSQIAQLYDWTARPGPEFQGNPTLLLHFTPRPDVHPGSRIQHVLLDVQGELQVNPLTGQLLSGHFESMRPMKFGMGLLGKFDHLKGRFEMQAAGSAWVFRLIQFEVDGRELWTRMHGVEVMDYALDPAAATPASPSASGHSGHGHSPK